jgi:hypothetical protein
MPSELEVVLSTRQSEHHAIVAAVVSKFVHLFEAQALPVERGDGIQLIRRTGNPDLRHGCVSKSKRFGIGGTRTPRDFHL